MGICIWYWCNNLSDDKTGMITSLAAMLAMILFIWNMIKSTTLPPGPRGFPIIGYLPFLGTHLHKKFTELAGVYGPVYKLWLGNKLCVVVSSPSLVKEVVRDHDTISANVFAPIAAKVAFNGGNDILFNKYCLDWKKMRKIFVTTLMSNASLDATYPFRKQEVKNSIKDVYCKAGKPLDINDISVSTFINSLQKVLWGGIIGTNIAHKVRKINEELAELIGAPNISDIFPMLSRFDIQGIERRTKNLVSWLDELLNCVIEHRMNLITTTKEDGINGEKDFLQILLELVDHEDTANSITMTQLKAMLLDVIAAATHTTSAMIEWTMAELMKHPEVMKKVQEELAQVVGMENSVEEFHLPKLRYLDAVLKEALRLYPPTPLIPHIGSEAGIISGYTIPKGSRIVLNVWAIHRDPQLWKNPLEFKPDRFLNVDNVVFDYMGNNFQYIPFGSGRRVCAGIPLFERMPMFFLASFLHFFDWKLPNDTKLDFLEKYGIVIKKANPLVVIPTPRLPNSKLYR